MEAISFQDLAALRSNANAPKDYVDWIGKHGWGEVGSASYMLYNGLIPLDEIAETAPSGYVSFGDDFSGYSGCFLIGGDGQVHEYDSALNEVMQTGLRFPEFIDTWRC